MKAGDIVELKSGGPVMTVSSVSGNSVNCIWFVECDTYQWNGPHYGSFYLESLVEVS